MLGEEKYQGELWFKQENSQAEWRYLFRLERELDAVLHFEHGDGSGGRAKGQPNLGDMYSAGKVIQRTTGIGSSSEAVCSLPTS